MKDAVKYLTMMWGGMMVGRFAGAYLVGSTPLRQSARGLCVRRLGGDDRRCNPVWPNRHVGVDPCRPVPFDHVSTIFALGIKGLGPLTEEASGLLITAIAGGALVVVQGWLADMYGLQNSFWLTVACELYVLWYALWGCKPTAAA